MAFVGISRKFALLASAAILVILIPRAAGASPISIYSTPSHDWHNNNLCIFSGTGQGTCPSLAGWPASVTDTNVNFPTLTHTYSSTEFTSGWMGFVGSSFVLGLDVNSSGTHQTLDPLTIRFFSGANYTEWTVSPTLLPDIHNGDGHSDYVLSAGCVAGGVYSWAGNPSSISACTQYLPFLVPAGTDSITFTFGYNGTGNDGHDDLFVIPYTDHVVPEPATLLLLSSGLLITAWRLRRRA